MDYYGLYHYASLVSTLYYVVVSISDTVLYIDYLLSRLAKAHFQCNLNFPSSSSHHRPEKRLESTPGLLVLEVHSRNATFLMPLQLFPIRQPFPPMISSELYYD